MGAIGPVGIEPVFGDGEIADLRAIPDPYRRGRRADGVGQNPRKARPALVVDRGLVNVADGVGECLFARHAILSGDKRSDRVGSLYRKLLLLVRLYAHWRQHAEQSH